MPQVIPVLWIRELQVALWSFLEWLERKPKARGPYSINTVHPIHIRADPNDLCFGKKKL